MIQELKNPPDQITKEVENIEKRLLMFRDKVRLIIGDRGAKGAMGFKNQRNVS